MRHLCKLSAAVVVAIVVPAFAQSTPQKAESAAAGNANVSITPRARTGAPEATESIVRQGADPTGSTPQAFQTYLKSEIVKWTNVIRAAGIRPE